MPQGSNQREFDFTAAERRTIRQNAVLPGDGQVSGKQIGLVLDAISRFGNESGKCYPSIATLAAESRCSQTTVKRAIAALQKLKVLLVRKERTAGKWERNNYIIVWPQLKLRTPEYLLTRRITPGTSHDATGDQSERHRGPVTTPPGTSYWSPTPYRPKKTPPLPGRRWRRRCVWWG